MWSAQQQSMLNAMGYTLYTRPGIRSVPQSASTQTVSVEASASSNTKPDASTDSRLFIAVMKAAMGRDISVLGIDIDALRSSPHAKRALWPQLRRVIKS